MSCALAACGSSSPSIGTSTTNTTQRPVDTTSNSYICGVVFSDYFPIVSPPGGNLITPGPAAEVENLLLHAKFAGLRQYAGVLRRDLHPFRKIAVATVMSEVGGNACTGLGIPIPT
jgi:hypothetical protein